MLVWLRGSLKRKLALTFSFIIILMVALVASFSYYQNSQTIRNDVEQSSRQILIQANLNLARYYRDNELFFTTLASSQEFHKWLLTPSAGAYSLIFAMKDMESRYIEPFRAYHPEILSIMMFNEDGSESIYRSPDPNSNAILKPGYSLKQENWLKMLKFSGDLVRIVNKSDRYADEYGRPKVIPVMTFVQKFQLQDQAGYLIMDISLEPTNDILQAIISGNKVAAIISDENGNIISDADTSKIAQPLPDSIRGQITVKERGVFFDKGSRNLVIFEPVPSSEWKTVVQMPYAVVMRSSNVVRNFTLTVAGLCLMGGLLLVIWVSDSITKRIMLLRKTIKATEVGNFDIRVLDSGVDEVAALARAYNHLLRRLSESIQQLTEAKLIHQKAILSALQSQINSHFLYNALESINSMANIAGHIEIRQTTLSLAKLLRYTSNYNQSMVTLREEAGSLNDYMHIITILYSDNIIYRIDIQPDLEDACCLKAMLQPIVENCIKHGYEITGEKLALEIRIKREDDNYVCITVQDNGPGIDREKLAQIRSRLEQKEPEKEFSSLDRVGLLNLHYRLKMVYPDARSGISIPDRETGNGTLIQIHFPYRREMASP